MVLAAFACVGTSAAYGSTIQELILDDTVGHSATIAVDNLGVVTCIGTCGGLTIPTVTTPHGTLSIFGVLGQFTIQVTDMGGATSIYPTMQNVTQISVASTAAGTLKTSFTDTGYCLGGGGGGCFGDAFRVSMTNNPGAAISDSSSTFGVMMDMLNGIPAGTLVSSDTLTGTTARVNSYDNPLDSPSGSLSTSIAISFTGRGSVQTTLQVSAVSSTVPEPSTFAMFTVAAGLLAFKVRQHYR